MDDSNQHPADVDASQPSSIISSSYSTILRQRFLSLCSSSSYRRLFESISSFYKRTIVPNSTPRRRRGASISYPVPSEYLYRFKLTDSSRICEVLDDISEHIFLNMHSIRKNIRFWRARAQGSPSQKANFMLLERGPRAFLDGSGHWIRDYVFQGTGMGNLSELASTYINERDHIFSRLEDILAEFLAQIYMEVHNFRKQNFEKPDTSLAPLLASINGFFLNLEAAIGNFSAKSLTGSSVDGSYSSPLLFEKLPDINQEESQCTDRRIRDTINLIYLNLNKLDVYLALLVGKYKKPRTITLHWLRYTFGAVGVSVFSLWLLSHSRVAGSPDIDKWILEAKGTITGFLSNHVEQPLIAIRDELFDTFRKRHRGVMDLEEVELTANSLHRMLLAFSEHTKGQKFPADASDQEMLEIVMGSYEKDLTHPIQNLIRGEHGHAMLIQIQKLKLDIETAMLELNQILRANEINFAILAALPAFSLSLLVLKLLRAWVKQDTSAEGRWRAAKAQRRLLINEIKLRMQDHRVSVIVKSGGEIVQNYYGLVLYALYRLYREVERYAKETGEWQCLRDDIYQLGELDVENEDVNGITSRLVGYLIPSSREQKTSCTHLDSFEC